MRYRGYYYDTETGFYYLQSRYYDPEICRFINADSYTSTGVGYLGYNMFAYCNNNPISTSDSDGYTPWSDLNSWGEIHNLVIDDILAKNNFWNSDHFLRKEVKCSTGRMDIFCEKTCEVWEVKSAGPASLLGMAQLYRYTQGTYKGMPITIGTSIYFYGSISRNGYQINYWSVGPGLIVYDFAHEGYQKDIVTVSAYEKRETERESRSKAGTVGVTVVGALGAGYAGAAIISAIGGPMASFKRNYYCFQ